MPEIGSSGLMSGDGRRGVGHRLQVTAPILDSTNSDIDYYRHPPLSLELSSRRRQRAAPASDLLLHVSEEARRRQRADERLFGHRSGDASDRGRLACDVQSVATGVGGTPL